MVDYEEEQVEEREGKWMNVVREKKESLMKKGSEGIEAWW